MMLRLLGLLLLLASCNSIASTGVAIPNALKEWVPWVLHENQQEQCPFHYQNGKQHYCAWPEALKLDLHEQGGYFKQEWEIHQQSWLALPGNGKQWPLEVKVDGKHTVVSHRNGAPHIKLEKGSYHITGKFRWNQLPNTLTIPDTTGLLELTINNKKINFPRMEANGQLWLNESTENTALTEENRLEVEVFRRVIDEVPLRLITRLDLNVVGQPREVVLGPLFPDDFIALSAKGPLPLRLELDGRLRVQVRPGNWLIEVEARHHGPAEELTLIDSNLPDSEIWVFDARPALRLVEIEGAETVDPHQTRLASDWQHLPSYRMTKQHPMQIITKRRGDPQPSSNSLHLQRSLWLDFSGNGYTFQDQISGTMHNQWRLDMSPNMVLGRAVVNGNNQLITQQTDSSLQGVEIRQSSLSLQVDGRYNGDITQLPAVGWQENFSQVQATLNLPPGWRLLSASGADSVGGASWLDQWTLLDIFLVLIASLAIYRMLGPLWGAIALSCFVFSWHESGAPQYIWLLVIASSALVRAAPDGRLRDSMQGLRYISLLLLLIVAIPYMVETVRNAIYPQLEQPTVMSYSVTSSANQAGNRNLSPTVEMDLSVMSPLDTTLQEASRSKTTEYRYSPVIDPHAKVQTGPGLPEWNWSSIPIRWDGPVQQSQQLQLTLLSPTQTTLLKLICVLLVSLLALRLAGFNLKSRRLVFESGKLVLLTLFIAAPLVTPQQAMASDIPSPALLKELQQRLLTPDECLPQCAQISRMKLTAEQDYLRILLEVHANQNVAIPLPGSHDSWLPQQISLNGSRSTAIRGPLNALWVQIPKGRHQIQLAGPLRSVRLQQLPLPLKPHHVELSSRGWQIKGVHPDGTIEQTLQLQRIITENNKSPDKVLEQVQLPAFVLVSRSLKLGLEWQLHTEVQRLSPTGSVIPLEIPLIEGEAVTSEGIRVVDNKALIQFAPNQQHIQWHSILPQTASLTLQASDTSHWVEHWKVALSPLWHATFDGIPQIYHQNRQQEWYPQWQPWPGEQLTLNFSRPVAIEGNTKTIDHSLLTLRPGERATDATLSLRLRSSQADQHIITLPADATLTRTEINGLSQPIRLEEGGVVRLPIIPGEQQLLLQWQTQQGITPYLQTPQVDLGMPSVNSNIELHLPESRWTLFTGGPQMGPAVLFWGVLLVVMLIAIGLGRSQQTPLKTHQWLLLGIGLSQTLIGVAIIVVAWLFIMEWRKRAGATLEAHHFNWVQVGVALITVLAITGLIGAVGFGLLGHPDMQIRGNDSSAHLLMWYADHTNELLPLASAITVPMWLYRVLMLAWSLWLAFALLDWLKWSWHCFLSDGLWQPIPKKAKKTKAKSTADPATQKNQPWLEQKDENRHPDDLL